MMNLPRYINREQSLIQFNHRVLAQAHNEDLPLLERLKYLCISSANLDEFMEVSMANLRDMAEQDPNVVTQPDAQSPTDLIPALRRDIAQLVQDQYDTLQTIMIPAMRQENIDVLRRRDWTDKQRHYIRHYFQQQLAPVLSPIALDPSHPFPRVQNKSLHFIISLDGEDAFGRKGNLAILEIPRSLPRTIRLPDELCQADTTDEKAAQTRIGLAFLSSIIHDNIQWLFPGMTVTSCNQFRVTRDSNLLVNDEKISDLMIALQGELPERDFGDAVRLEVSDVCPEPMIEFLLDKFQLSRDDCYQVNGPVNLHRLSEVPDLIQRTGLRFKTHKPNNPFEENEPHLTSFMPLTAAGANASSSHAIFAKINQGDILLHHPFDSFNPVIDFVQQAAKDPAVLAIRMTLYRTGAHSSIVDALEKAALADKEVTVVVELRARFDEDNNIRQAARLQAAGAHVVYGVVGYKTHAKMIHVVRKEKEGLKHYVHLGTGNYHHLTSRFYTDFGLFSANQTLGEDVNKVFRLLTSQSAGVQLNKLLYAPFTLKKTLLAHIDQEITNAKAGKPAHIMAKMNGLQEKSMIDALYQASQAGVEIDLIVRGICCLRPQVPGLSDNIRVRSIIGRFLEHTRVFYFRQSQLTDTPSGEKGLMYIASADWMGRNLNGRVEVCTPIEDPAIFQRIYHEGLALYLQDNCLAWTLQADGQYAPVHPQPKQKRLCSQNKLAGFGTD